MTNGQLRYKAGTGGGLNASGDPIAVTNPWSDPIDCLIVPNSKGNLTKYQDGAQVAASYTITIEMQTFDQKTIKLTNDQGTELGEYQVLKPNIRHLQAVQRIQILV